MINIHPQRSHQSAPNLTPLVDIVFLLLIFFLLTAFFIQPEGMGIKLPEAESDPAPPDSEVTVAIHQEGPIEVDGTEVAAADLVDAIAAALAGKTDRTVVVKSDKTVVLQRVIMVMEAAKKADASRLIIATERPSGDLP